MSSEFFTTDSLRVEVGKMFEPFRITLSDATVCELKAVIRMPADSRGTIAKALEELDGLDVSEMSSEVLDRAIEVMSRIFYVAADKPAKLMSDLRDEDKAMQVALMTRVLTAWMGATEVGEA